MTFLWSVELIPDVVGLLQDDPGDIMQDVNNDVLVGLMPDVFGLLQDDPDDNDHNRLNINSTFKVLRNWKLPMLFSFLLGLELFSL